MFDTGNYEDSYIGRINIDIQIENIVDARLRSTRETSL